jgi:hypothetical protein
MQRLRPLSEAECYARCYGERDDSVTLLEVGPHPLGGVEAAVSSGSLDAGYEERDARAWSVWGTLMPLSQRPD